MNTLLREKRTVLPTLRSNLYSFQYQPKKREKRGKQTKYLDEEILRHYRKSFSVVMETQKAQARKKKSK